MKPCGHYLALVVFLNIALFGEYEQPDLAHAQYSIGQKTDNPYESSCLLEFFLRSVANQPIPEPEEQDEPADEPQILRTSLKRSLNHPVLAGFVLTSAGRIFTIKNIAQQCLPKTNDGRRSIVPGHISEHIHLYYMF